MDQNKVVGNYKHYNNFTFVVLYGSGHYIPHDVPEASIEMISRFYHNFE